MNCKECSKFNKCEKAKHLENYTLIGCKDFILNRKLFVERMGRIHTETVEKLLKFADSSGFDRNGVIYVFLESFITMDKMTDYDNYEVKMDAKYHDLIIVFNDDFNIKPLTLRALNHETGADTNVINTLNLLNKAYHVANNKSLIKAIQIE